MPGQSTRWTLALPATLSVTLLAGCGGIDQVELKGGVFDLMGVSTASLTRRGEAKVEQRPGIVMPPSTERLPVPGSAPAAPPTVDGEAWPVGPEDRKRAEQQRLIAEHRAHCEKAIRERDLVNPDGAPPQGPLGSCEPGVYEKLFGSSFPGSKKASGS